MNHVDEDDDDASYATRRMREREREAQMRREKKKKKKKKKGERDARRQTDGSKSSTRRYGDLDRSPSIILILCPLAASQAILICLYMYCTQ